MTKGKCESCNKQVEGKKKPFSIFMLIITGCIYAIYRLVFVSRNRCPICGLKIKVPDGLIKKGVKGSANLVKKKGARIMSGEIVEDKLMNE